MVQSWLSEVLTYSPFPGERCRVRVHVVHRALQWLAVLLAALGVTNPTDTSSTIPHMFDPRTILKYPSSPQDFPQEFRTFQYICLRDSPYPTIATPWSNRGRQRLGFKIPRMYICNLPALMPTLRGPIIAVAFTTKSSFV